MPFPGRGHCLHTHLGAPVSPITTPKTARLILIAVMMLCLCIVSAATTGRAHAEKVTLGSFNLENFFDVWDDPYTQDGDPKPAPKIKPMGLAVANMDADILGVCEVENGHVLQRLVDDHAPHANYQHIFTQPTNSNRGIHLGFMSRFPVESVTSYRFNTLKLPNDSREWTIARDLLHATFRVGEHRLHVFMAHFKSKRDSRGDKQSASWRLAEAVFTRKIVDDLLQADPQAMIAVMGDLNDTLESPTLRALLADARLIDAHHDKPKTMATYLREPYRSKIDYILVSPALAKHQTASGIVTDPKMLKGSDHAPITASFDLPD